MAPPFSISLLGGASLAAVLVASGAYVVVAGLRAMSQDGLPLTHRRTIGRYMLAGMGALVLIALIVSVGQLRGNLEEIRPAHIDHAQATPQS